MSEKEIDLAGHCGWKRTARAREQVAYGAEEAYDFLCSLRKRIPEFEEIFQMLRELQQGSISIELAIQRVLNLLGDHPDLLDIFRSFVPEPVSHLLPSSGPSRKRVKRN